MLVFTCEKCSFKGREFLKWQNHLFDSEHQSVVRNTYKSWEDEDNLKSLLLFAQKEAPPPQPSEVIGLFHSLEIIVEDFVCWTAIPRMFIIQLGNREEVDRVLQVARQQTETFCIHGKSVDFRRKSDVLEGEWGVYESIVKEGIEIEMGDPSKLPIEIIEICDDDDDIEDRTAEIPQTSRKRKRKNTRGRDKETSPVVEVDRMECSDQEQEPELSQQNGNGRASTSSQEDEVQEDVVIKTIMQSAFIVAFNSRFKLEKGEGEDEDDKKKVKAQLKAMKEKWADIYLRFHNRIWPICFGMVNTHSPSQSRNNKYGIEASFDCKCNPTKSNDWISKKTDAKNVKEKVEEFFEILSNETQCNRILQRLRLPPLKLCHDILLSFTCHVIISYNKSDAVAELKFSNVKGKNAKRKMGVVQSIFKKLFKKYEMMMIKKFSSTEVERPPCSSKGWNQIANAVELE